MKLEVQSIKYSAKRISSRPQATHFLTGLSKFGMVFKPITSRPVLGVLEVKYSAKESFKAEENFSAPGIEKMVSFSKF